MGLGSALRMKVSACAVGLAVGVFALGVSAIADAAPLTYTFRTTLQTSTDTYGTGWFSYDPDAAQEKTVESDPWTLVAWQLGKIVFWSEVATNTVPASFQFYYYDDFVGALTTKDVAAFHFQDDANGALFALNVQNMIDYHNGDYESYFLTGTAGKGQPGYASSLVHPLSYENQSSRFRYQTPTETVTSLDQNLVLHFPQPVPEPGSLLLLGTGLFGLARLIRSRTSA